MEKNPLNHSDILLKRELQPDFAAVAEFLPNYVATNPVKPGATKETRVEDRNTDSSRPITPLDTPSPSRERGTKTKTTTQQDHLADSDYSSGTFKRSES